MNQYSYVRGKRHLYLALLYDITNNTLPLTKGICGNQEKKKKDKYINVNTKF